VARSKGLQNYGGRMVGEEKRVSAFMRVALGGLLEKEGRAMQRRAEIRDAFQRSRCRLIT